MTTHDTPEAVCDCDVCLHIWKPSSSTTHDTPEAVKALAGAWSRYLAATAPGAFTAEQLMDDAGGILSALDGWRLVPNVATADWTGSTKRAEAELTRLRAALERIAEPGCEASRWANEEPPVPDRCLDPDYIELFDAENGNRCGPCEARAALAPQGTVVATADWTGSTRKDAEVVRLRAALTRHHRTLHVTQEWCTDCKRAALASAPSEP